MKTNFLQRCFSLLLLFLLCFIFIINLAIEIDATAPNQAFLNQCDLTLLGSFNYLRSDSGTPTQSLHGQTHRIYFSGNAEKSLYWRSKTNDGISNANSTTIDGYLSLGYKIKIDFADTVAVYQLHRNSSSTNTYYTWAYYQISVIDDDISTDLLYRTQRSNNTITYIISGLVLLFIYMLFKILRRGR